MAEAMRGYVESRGGGTGLAGRLWGAMLVKWLNDRDGANGNNSCQVDLSPILNLILRC